MNIQFNTHINIKNDFELRMKPRKTPTFSGLVDDTFDLRQNKPKKQGVLSKIATLITGVKDPAFLSKKRAKKVLFSNGFSMIFDDYSVDRILSAVKEEKGYPLSVIDDIVTIRKLSYGLESPIISNCMVDVTDNSDKEAQKAFLSASRKMLEIGISARDVINLLHKLNLRGTKYDAKAAELLVSDIPNEGNKNLLMKFLYERFKATYSLSERKYQKNDMPNMDNYQYMNKIFNECAKSHSYLNILSGFIVHHEKVEKSHDFIYEFCKYGEIPFLTNHFDILGSNFVKDVLDCTKQLDEEEKSEFYKALEKLDMRFINEYLRFQKYLKNSNKDEFWLVDCLRHCEVSHRLSNTNLKFLREHINEENTAYYLENFSYTRDVKSEMFPMFKACTELGTNQTWLPFRLSGAKYPFDKKRSNGEIKKVFNKYKEKGYNPEFMLPIITSSPNEESSDILSYIINFACDNRGRLGSANHPFTNTEIIQLLLDGSRTASVLKSVDVLGKETFVHLFDEGYEKVEEYLNMVNKISLNYLDMQPLYELVNPKQSVNVLEMEETVKTLKHELHEINDPKERTSQINKINKISKEKNTIINNAIKDPAQKIRATLLYYTLVNDIGLKSSDYELANSFVPYMNPKNEEEKKIYNEKLNDLILQILNIKKPEAVKDKLDFSKSRYIEKLFLNDNEFKKTFKTLVSILNSHPLLTVNVALDLLEHNGKTAELFKYYGLDYRKWVDPNPDLKIHVNIQNNFEKSASNAIKNIEKEFDDKFFKTLPIAEQNRMMNVLNKAGYNFVKKEEAVYDDTGYCLGTDIRIRLYKGDKPVEFNDLSKVLKIITNEFGSNSFWNKRNQYADVEIAKGTFKDHIAKRHDEIKSIKQLSENEDIKVTIQKADMNDIPHSLFLGNDSSCCTAIGSFNSWTAPQYIMNKFVQCIELKDGDKFVGNTMIYPVVIDEKPALLIDNVELKPKYQYDPNIEAGICKFAKMLAKEIGKPDMEIYAGTNRHKLDMKNFDLQTKCISVLGYTDENGIYADFDGGVIDAPSFTIDEELFKLKSDF